MKLIILLLISYLAYLASGKTLVGSWAVNATCNDYCCCPNGTLTIQADSKNISQVIAQAASWNNNPICQSLGLTSSTSSIALPH